MTNELQKLPAGPELGAASGSTSGEKCPHCGEVPADSCIYYEMLDTTPYRKSSCYEREIAALKSGAAINTNVRLFDLVRYMRSELHQSGLLTDEEYLWITCDAPMSKSPKGGSPSPRRLEDYDRFMKRHREILDKLRAENKRLRADRPQKSNSDYPEHHSR